MTDDGKVFDRLFGPSELNEASKPFWRGDGWSETLTPTPRDVDVVALIRAIDKLEASVARLKRFLQVTP